MEPGGDAYARCRFCGAVARLPGPPAAAASTEPDTTPRAPLSLPSGVTVAESGGRLTITRRWFHWAALFLAFFTVVWNGFLVFWYAMGARTGAPLVMFLFPIVHVVVGVALAYGTLAMFLNRTVVEVGDGVLAVRHGPLPWKPGPTVPSSNVRQVFAREDRSKGGNGSGGVSYSVHAVTKEGWRVKLLSTVPSAEQALYVEQRVERHLGIADRAVAGELPRD
jgi:hypothetical protein